MVRISWDEYQESLKALSTAIEASHSLKDGVSAFDSKMGNKGNKDLRRLYYINYDFRSTNLVKLHRRLTVTLSVLRHPQSWFVLIRDGILSPSFALCEEFVKLFGALGGVHYIASRVLCCLISGGVVCFCGVGPGGFRA